MVRQESGVNTCIASSEKTDETLFRQICTGMRPTEHDTACSGVRTSMASVSCDTDIPGEQATANATKHYHTLNLQKYSRPQHSSARPSSANIPKLYVSR